VSNILIEENVIDNGHLLFNGTTLPDHGMYLDSELSSGIVVRGNIVSRHPSHGIQCRPGGAVLNNLVLEVAIGILLGNSEANNTPNGVDGTVSGNVILHGRDFPSDYGPRGWGLYLENIHSALISKNVVAHVSPSATGPRPISLDARFHKVHGTTLSENIVYGWGVQADYASVYIQGNAGPAGLDQLRLQANDLQNSLDPQPFILFDSESGPSVTTSGTNRFVESFPTSKWFLIGGQPFSLAAFKSLLKDTTSTGLQQVPYSAAPNATIPGYMEFLGYPSTLEAFYGEVRKQSKDNWRPEFTAASVNDWIRTCFNKPAF